jgi:protein-tyrosine phosphatase
LYMGRILFVCTGNYYRSRFAEIYFNVLSDKHHMGWEAFSRGFRTNSMNKGLISPYAIQQLDLLKIPLPENLGSPKNLGTLDLHSADIVIALDEDEHRPFVKEHFHNWEHKFNFWQIKDIQFELPASALEKLKDRVEELAASIQSSKK